MKSKTYKILGYLAFIIGIISLANSASNITGFAIVDEVSDSVSVNLAILFFIAGFLLLFLESRLEDKEGVLEILISKKAINKVNKDKRLRSERKKVLKEIEKISQNPDNRPTERIGEFLISPRGHKAIRIAWTYNPKEKIIKIYDILHHTGNRRGYDGWADNVREGGVKQKNYGEFVKYG